MSYLIWIIEFKNYILFYLNKVIGKLSNMKITKIKIFILVIICFLMSLIFLPFNLSFSVIFAILFFVIYLIFAAMMGGFVITLLLSVILFFIQLVCDKFGYDILKITTGNQRADRIVANIFWILILIAGAILVIYFGSSFNLLGDYGYDCDKQGCYRD